MDGIPHKGSRIFGWLQLHCSIENISSACTQFIFIVLPRLLTVSMLLSYFITQFSTVWRDRFHAEDVKVLLALKCGLVGVNVMPWTGDHPHAGLGMFVGRTNSRDEAILAYYGLLVCTDRFQKRLSNEVYGEGVMVVSIITFNRWAIVLLKMATDCQYIEHSCGIVASPFSERGSLMMHDTWLEILCLQTSPSQNHVFLSTPGLSYRSQKLWNTSLQSKFLVRFLFSCR